MASKEFGEATTHKINRRNCIVFIATSFRKMLFSNIIIIQPQTALKIGVSLAVMQKVKTNKYF